MRTRTWSVCIGVLIASVTVTGMSFGAGEAGDKTGRETVGNGPKDIPPGWERMVFIHYRKPRGKPADKPGRTPPTQDSQCYTFLGKGVKWKDPAFSAFMVDATNDAGLGPDAVLDAISAAADTWASKTAAGILPTCTLAADLTADWDSPDGFNEVVFGDLDTANAIAVTIVWGIFGGPPSQREIVEFDMIFDDQDFDWSAGEEGVEGKMDLENIATHELGHAVGLGDLYDTGCAEATMYGYSGYAETDKRTLETGDIAGLQELYGE